MEKLPVIKRRIRKNRKLEAQRYKIKKNKRCADKYCNELISPNAKYCNFCVLKGDRRSRNYHKGKSNPLYGIPRSEAVKNKISNANKGNMFSALSRMKMSESHKRLTGSKSSRWKGGKPRCPICNKEICYGSKYCQSHLYILIGGEKSHLWKGGKSFEIYPPEFNKRLKEKIKKRDGHTCQLCGDYIPVFISQKERLVVHHIDYDKQNCNEDNLTALCHFCNISVNKSREQWTKYFNSKMAGGI